jgi:HD superfamily phosphodiesterase
MDFENMADRLFLNFDVEPPAPYLVEFALRTIKENEMDFSHSLNHFLAVRKNAQIILDSEFSRASVIHGLTKRLARKIVLDAAFLHDCVDSKYMDELEGKVKLIECLRDNWQGNPTDLACYIWSIINIISSISFHTRVDRLKQGLDPFENNRYLTANKIVCDADHLDAYDPIRCINFTKRSLRYELDDVTKIRKIYRRSRGVLVDRILRYKDCYMNTKTGKLMAIPRHAALERFVSTYYETADILAE